jgi:polyisoprenyl-phosphate glycosyltransferase
LVENKLRKRVGIVIPVLNDWASLDLIITKLSHQAERNKLNFHIFVVDDGSSEKPPCFLGKGQAHVDIQLIRLANNLGHQRAIAIGLVIASSFEDIGAVVVMDADGEDRPEDVPRLLNAWGEDPNLIVVAQRSERSEGLVFKFFYALYKLAFRIVTGQKIDFGNFCLIPRASLPSLTYNPAIWNFAMFEYGISAKWLELLREISPAVKRVGVLREPTVAGIGQLAAMQTAAPSPMTVPSA